jgi:hypothetical protein
MRKIWICNQTNSALDTIYRLSPKFWAKIRIWNSYAQKQVERWFKGAGPNTNIFLTSPRILKDTMNSHLKENVDSYVYYESSEHFVSIINYMGYEVYCLLVCVAV